MARGWEQGGTSKQNRCPPAGRISGSMWRVVEAASTRAHFCGTENTTKAASPFAPMPACTARTVYWEPRPWTSEGLENVLGLVAPLPVVP